MSDGERMVEPTVGQLGLCGEDAGSMIVVQPEWLEDEPMVGLEGDLSWLTGKP